MHWVDIAHCDAAESGDGLTSEAAMARLHCVKKGKNGVSVTDAFITLRRVPANWARAGHLLAFNTVLWLFERAGVAFPSLRRRLRPV